MINNDDITYKKDVAPSVPRSWHELYIEAQSDPMDARTDKEFCEEIQLDVNTFRNWKCKYRSYIFREVEARRKNYVNELRSKGHKALAKKLDKDTNAIKLLFQLLGDLVEKTESKVDLNHGDKVRRVNTLLGEIGKRQRQWDEADKPQGSSEPKGPLGPITP